MFTHVATLLMLPDVCHSFPEPLEHALPRKQILRQIEDIFLKNPVVIIDDSEESGKTTLLAQYAQQHPRNTISVFLNPSSRQSYSPHHVCNDICRQIFHAVNPDPRDAPAYFELAQLAPLKTQLAFRARNEKFTFVVDGLGQLPETDAAFVRDILAMLPLGQPRMRFLLSGQASNIPLPLNISPRPLNLPYLSLEEAIHFFRDPDGTEWLEREDIEDIYRIFVSVSDLAAVRRVLKGRDNPKDWIADWPQHHPNLFRLQWQDVDENSDVQILGLALLCHINRSHSLQELARVIAQEFPASAEELRQALKPLRFLILGAHESGSSVAFVAESVRQYASHQLRHLKGKADQLFLRYMMEQENAPSAVEVTDYLEQAHHDEEFVDYLNSERIVQMLNDSGSLSLVSHKTAAAVEAAYTTNRVKELTHFCLQKSALASVSGAKIWRSQVEAYVALNDYDGALVLAQSALLLEDQLHQLAVVAKAQHNRKLPLDSSLDELIRATFQRLDASQIAGDAVEIAADLLPTHPDLALKLVEESNNTFGTNALDWAFARLSLEAIKDNEDQEDSAILPTLQTRIADPKAQQFLSVAALLYGYGKFSGPEIIAESERLTSPDQRLFVLRQWATGNAGHTDSSHVLNHALDVLIGQDYVPTARDLRQFAVALPEIVSLEELRELVLRFDGVRAVITHRISTEDDTAVQLALAEAEFRFDFGAARNRVIEVYLALADVNDVVIKAASLARLVSALERLDPDRKLEATDKIHSLARADLEASFDEILNATADHHEATRNIIRPLARTHCELALEWIARLNTLVRRDAARHEFVKAICFTPLAKLNFSALGQALDAFEENFWRDVALDTILHRLDAIDEEADAAWDLRPLLPILERVKQIESCDSRCVGLCLNVSIVCAHAQRTSSDKFASLRDGYVKMLEQTWAKIPAAWTRTDIGFQIVAALGKWLPDVALEFKSSVEAEASDHEISNEITAHSYLSCLYLANRIFAGFSRQATDEDKERLHHFIERVPSPSARIGLWSDLALRAWKADAADYGKKIIETRLRPALVQLKTDDPENYRDALMTCASALYLDHPIMALNEIKALPTWERDGAASEIGRYFLEKCPSSDPFFASERKGYKLIHAEALDICQILDLIENDALIYGLVESLCDALLTKQSAFSREVKNDVAANLQRQVTRLKSEIANSRYIRHEGYVILIEAQIARLQGATVSWDDLIRRGRAISNLADRALVLCSLAVLMNSHDAKAEALLKEAEEVSAQIPTTHDRLAAYKFLAMMAKEVNSIVGKHYLSAAMAASRSIYKAGIEDETEQKRASNIARQLLDVAHTISPEFATHLATLADDDPARATLGTKLEKHVKFLELRDKISKERCESTELFACQPRECARIAWNLLGKLNAHRLDPWRSNEAKPFIRIASQATLQTAYPILAWALENTVRRQQGAANIRELLWSAFDAALGGAEISLQVAHRTAQEMQSAKASSSWDEHQSCVIGVGEEERIKGEKWVANWIKEDVCNTLRICDAFLNAEDVCALVRQVQQFHPDCVIEVLTSREKLSRNLPEQSKDWASAFERLWDEITESAPPDTTIIVAAVQPGGASPIHDRWFLTENAGMMNGTSHNGIASKLHHLRRLTPEEAAQTDAKLDPYFRRSRKTHGDRNEKIIEYTRFILR